MKKVGLVVLIVLMILGIGFGIGYWVGVGPDQPVNQKQVEQLTERDKSLDYIEKGTATILIGDKFYAVYYEITGGPTKYWYFVDIKDSSYSFHLQDDYNDGKVDSLGVFGEELRVFAHRHHRWGDSGSLGLNVDLEDRLSEFPIPSGVIKSIGDLDNSDYDFIYAEFDTYTWMLVDVAELDSETATQLLEMGDSIIQQLKP